MRRLALPLALLCLSHAFLSPPPCLDRCCPQRIIQFPGTLSLCSSSPRGVVGTSLHSHAIPESDEQIIDDRLKELSAKGQYDDTEFYAAITKLEPETDVPFFTNLANTYKGELPRGPVNKILYIIKDLYAEFNSYRFPSFGVVAQRMLIVFVTIAVVIVGSFCLDEIVRGLVRALYLFEAPQGVGILGTAKAFFSYIYLNSKNYLGNFHLQSIIRRQEYETMLRYKVKRFDAIWPRGPPITA